jgi:hypothetical protein
MCVKRRHRKDNEPREAHCYHGAACRPSRAARQIVRIALIEKRPQGAVIRSFTYPFCTDVPFD